MLRLRTFFIYTAAVFLMYLLLGLSFYLASFLVMKQNPEIERDLEELTRIYHLDPVELRTEPAVRERVELLAPILSRIDWRLVALLASLTTFSMAGFFCGRFSGDPRWVGVLPLLAVVTGHNPAIIPTLMENQGVPDVQLPFGVQVALLTIQLLSAYFGAELGARMLGRSRSPANGKSA
ncbi:MAG: hypothetical protein HY319_09135 [Armatimonadetes bacterium]|nr:hypothetical protein [Armatimonadota bacterium]